MTVYDFVCEYKHDYECSYDHDRWKLTMNHVHWRSLHDSEQSCHDNSKALECTLCMLTSDILMQIWFAISEGELPHFPAFSPSISGGESELPQFPLLNKASEAGTESAPVSISTITSINISVIPMLNKSAEKKQKKPRSERPLKEIAQQSEFCFLRFGVCICFNTCICICIRLINSSRGEWIEVKGVIKYQYRIFIHIFVDKSIVELRLREVYLCVFFLFLLALYLYLYLYAWLCLFSNLYLYMYSYQLFYLYLYPCVFVLTKDLLWVCREGLARWGAAASMYSLTLSFLPCTVFTPPPMSSSSSA